MPAPDARNAAVVIKLKAGGGIEHVPAPDEASSTVHEFYIICAALSVRASLCACHATACTALRNDRAHVVHAQASVYKSFNGRHPPASSSAMYLNVKPKKYWVTSRQAPGVFWVDEGTEQARYAFTSRDTSAYPQQSYLDHGDLAEEFKASFDRNTLPKECIGRKGAGGDYFPTEDQLLETLMHISAGVPCLT